MIKPLEYYYVNGTRVIFNKYTIDENGVIRNKKNDRLLRTYKDKGGYKAIAVYDNDGNSHIIRVARALASTFIGSPPTLEHTADHIDRNRENDTLDNIHWLCKSGQQNNRNMPETLKTAFIIDRYGEEKTFKDWVEYLKYDKNHMKRQYTESMITDYTQRKKYGFSYKEYPDLPGEVWKEIIGSKNAKGRWEISDTNRVKYITKYAENVLSGERLGLQNKYPVIYFDGKIHLCHIVSFKTFYPEVWAAKKPNEIVLHEDDDPMDFRPHKLRLGTRNDNNTDAHDNGCYDDAKTARMKCSSYVNDILEKKHCSQRDAVKYLKSIGYDKATESNICMTLSGNRKTAYGRTWKLST
jgi:hypothetical protein